MQTDKNSYSSIHLLTRVDESQLDDLLIGEQIRKETEGGINFFFVIDHSEISRYCFPFGLPAPFGKDSEELANIDSTSEWENTLHNVFSRKVFFLDEHFDELRNLIYKVSQIINDKNSKDILLNELKSRSESIEQSADLMKFVEDNFQLLLHYALELIGSGISRLNKLLNPDPEIGSLILQHDERIPDPYNYIVENIVSTKKSSNAEILFNQFKGDIILDDRKEKNLKVDFQVLDRIKRINERLENDYLKNYKSGNTLQPRNIVLFLSSSTLLWRFVKQDSFIENMPVIAGYKYNFFRTIDQSFLYTLSVSKVRSTNPIDNSTLYDKDRYDFLSKLKTLKKHGWEKVPEYTSLYEDLAIKPIVSDFENRYRNLMQQIKFEGFVSNAEAFRKVLNQKPSDLKREATNDAFSNILAKAFNIIYEHIGKINPERKMDLLVRLTARSKYIQKFEEGLINLQKSFLQSSYTPPRGNDYIVGTAQHLPILFYYCTDKYKSVIEKILSFYIRVEREPSPIATVFKALDELNNNYKRVQAVKKSNFDILSFREEQEANIVSLLCYFLFQSGKIIEKPDDDIVSLSNEFISELNMQEGACKFSNYSTEISTEFNRYRCNYLYILCWVNRRSKDYANTISLADVGIKVSLGQDLRFHQAKCLVNYNLSEKESDPVATYKFLSKALKYGEKSLLLCDSSYSLNELCNNINFIQNTKHALLNTNVYLLSLIIELEEDSNNQKLLLIKLDKYLNELVSILGDSFVSYPEYIHTRAIALLIISKVYLRGRQYKSNDVKNDLNAAYNYLILARQNTKITDQNFLKIHYDDRLLEITSLLTL